MKNKSALVVLSFLFATAILLGAFAAHGLKDKLTEVQLANWETGVRYLVYHIIGAFVVILFQFRILKMNVKAVLILFYCGMLLFSGSLFFLATLELTGLLSMKLLFVPMTPIGGLCFVAGWILFGIKILKLKND